MNNPQLSGLRMPLVYQSRNWISFRRLNFRRGSIAIWRNGFGHVRDCAHELPRLDNLWNRYDDRGDKEDREQGYTPLHIQVYICPSKNVPRLRICQHLPMSSSCQLPIADVSRTESCQALRAKRTEDSNRAILSSPVLRISHFEFLWQSIVVLTLMDIS